MKPSPITPTIDLMAEGRQHGHLKLPYSRDDSAWGAILIPITVIRNGQGPTALLTGGNHGDEYEGPIALFDLAHSLEASSITGAVIIVPAMNYPAFRAGVRTSPIDQGNMNRVFPGRSDGTITEKIADYFQRILLPIADLVVDIHSGGRTLDFLPLAAAHVLPDKEQQDRCVAAMRAFGAPYSVMLLEIDAVGMYDTAAEAMGKTFVSTELGGGGTATAKTVAIAKRGLQNCLSHAGILKEKGIPSETRLLDMPDADCYVTADRGGLIEPCVDLGARVEKGDVIARIFQIERSGETPSAYKAKRAGILAGRHFPGLVQTGDTIGLVAVPVD